MIITKRQLIMSAVGWLALPLALFLLFWVKEVISVPLTSALVAGVIRIFREIRNPDSCVMNIDRKFWLMAILIFGFTIYTGIGGFFYQDVWDHSHRNLVFEVLVNEPWPVVHGYGSPDQQLLSYYLGFWLPPALLAKWTGSLLVGNIAQLIYAYCGFMLTALLVMRILHIKRANIGLLFVFVFYSAWTAVITLIYNPGCIAWTLNSWIRLGNEGGVGYYSAPGVSILAFYIYNQGIASWMGLGLLWLQRNNLSTLCLIYSLLFLFAPIPSLGVLPVMIYWMFKHFKQSLTLWNIVGAVVFLVIASYYMANNNGGHLTVAEMDNDRLIKLLVFLLFSYVVYFPFIWRQIRRNTVFWILFVSSVLFAELRLNGELDLAWRVSIPLVFYMTVIVMRAVIESNGWSSLRRFSLIAALAIGMIGSAGSMFGSLYNAYNCVASRTPFYAHRFNDLFDKDDVPCYSNFIADGEGFFSRYLMRRPVQEHTKKETNS